MKGPERDQGMEQIVNLLKAMATTMRMYSADHRLTTECLQNLHIALTDYLKNKPKAVLTHSEGQLWADRVRAVTVQGFREMMMTREVRCIRFSQGLALGELKTFSVGLIKPKEEMKEFIEFKTWLENHQVTHIEIDDMVDLDPEQERRVLMKAQGMGGAMDPALGDMVGTLQRSVEWLKQNGDPLVQRQILHKMNRDLQSAPPEKLEALYLSPEAESGPVAGMLEQFTQSLSREKIEEVVKYACRWQLQHKVSVTSGAELQAKKENLKAFLKKILRAPESKNISPGLYAYLRSVGLLEHVPGKYFTPGEMFAFAGVAENLLQLPSDFLLNSPLRENVILLIQKTCAKGEDDALRKIVLKVLENLTDPNAAVCRPAVDLLRKIQNILQVNRKNEMTMVVTGAFLECMRNTADFGVYVVLTDAVQADALDLLLAGQSAESAEVLRQLRVQSLTESPEMPGRQETALKALHAFSQRALPVLSDDLSSEQPSREESAKRILPQLGEAAVAPLLESLKRTWNPRTQQGLLQALDRLGFGAQKALLKQLDTNAPASEIVRILSMLEQFMDPSMFPEITNLLGHADVKVRRKAVRVISTFQDESVPPLLVSLMDDADLEIQTLAVRQLGEKGWPGTVTELVRKLPEAGVVLQEEICQALGRLGDPAAIVALAECLGARRGFIFKNPVFPDSVRLQAAMALKRFPLFSEAREALFRAQKDPSPAVRQAVA